MTQDQPDRLDRIEVTLERVSQQLDNQVVVNAELRQVTAQLQQAMSQMQQIVEQMQQTVGDLTGSVGELSRSVSSLIQIAHQQQENIMTLATEMRDVRIDMREMMNDIRGLYILNQEILKLLQSSEINS